MLGKINIDFLYLRRKRRVCKRSGIFHFAFFFAGCRFDFLCRCGYRFAFSMATVVLANSFRFANVVRPSVFNFAPVVTEYIAVFRAADFTNRFVFASCRSARTICCFGMTTIFRTSAGMRSITVAYPITPIVNMGVYFFGIIVRNRLAAPAYNLV